MSHDEKKLCQLYLSYVLFPEKVLLHVRSKSSQTIIRIHDDMDEGVNEGTEGRMTSRSESDREPHIEGHGHMMNEMKSRYLTVLLSKHEEDGVQKFDELGKVENPSDMNHANCVRMIGFVNRLTLNVIFAKPAVDSEEPKQISIKYYHGKVVDNHGSPEVVRLSSFHDLGSEVLDEEEVHETE